MTYKLMLHFRNQAIIAPIENLTELRHRLHIGYAYTEVLGDCTYYHYDVLGIRRKR